MSSSFINIKNLKELAQKRIKGLTDSSALSDLENLMKIAMLSGGGHLEVDSDGLLPSSGRVAFDKQYSKVFFNTSDSDNTYWEELIDNGTYTEPAVSITQAQGQSFGYVAGGQTAPPAAPGTQSASNVIEKFSFTSDQNATDVGDLTVAKEYVMGQSSSTHGYVSGGRKFTPTTTVLNEIEKYPFATDENASDVGDLTSVRYLFSGTGQMSTTHGYASGGYQPTYSDTIDKFSFTSDGNATDVGNLTDARYITVGQSSETHGYSAGGFSPPRVNIIDKFPFATDGNATDVGDLTIVRLGSAGQSSPDHGFVAGGDTNIAIDKYSFVTDGNATDVGDLSYPGNANDLTGQSAASFGYTTGGQGNPSATVFNIIDKFPYAITDGNATDVGDLTLAHWRSAGAQV